MNKHTYVHAYLASVGTDVFSFLDGVCGPDAPALGGSLEGLERCRHPQLGHKDSSRQKEANAHKPKLRKTQTMRREALR